MKLNQRNLRIVHILYRKLRNEMEKCSRKFLSIQGYYSQRIKDKL